MNLDPFIQSLTWYAHMIAPCLVPPPEQPSTAVPGCVENLPKDIALLIMQRVFAQSKGAYGALLQTCKTTYGTWNNAFISTQEKLPLYKTLITCSNGDDERVSAIFERAFGLKGEPLRFPGEEKLKCALTDSSSKTSLLAIAARFPDCTHLFIEDKRTPVAPQTPTEVAFAWLGGQELREPKALTSQAEHAIILAANALENLRSLHFTYHVTRPLRAKKIAGRLTTMFMPTFYDSGILGLSPDGGYARGSISGFKRKEFRPIRWKDDYVMAEMVRQANKHHNEIAALLAERKSIRESLRHFPPIATSSVFPD